MSNGIPPEMQAVINELMAQRDLMAARAANLASQLALANLKAADYEAQLKANGTKPPPE